MIEPDGDAGPGAMNERDAVADVLGRRTRIAAYALCLDEAGRILLCRLAPIEADVGRWTLPGGGLEFGEDPLEGCLRELEEETGLNGTVLDLAGVDSQLYTYEREHGPVEMHSIRILYRVAITGGTLRDELDGSTDRCAWLNPSEVAELPLVDLVEVALPLFQQSPG